MLFVSGTRIAFPWILLSLWECQWGGHSAFVLRYLIPSFRCTSLATSYQPRLFFNFSLNSEQGSSESTGNFCTLFLKVFFRNDRRRRRRLVLNCAVVTWNRWNLSFSLAFVLCYHVSYAWRACENLKILSFLALTLAHAFLISFVSKHLHFCEYFLSFFSLKADTRPTHLPYYQIIVRIQAIEVSKAFQSDMLQRHIILVQRQHLK